MTSCQKAARPLSNCLRQGASLRNVSLCIRTFASSATQQDAAVETTAPAGGRNWDPATVTSPRGERALLRKGILPIGSRRRRAAIKSSDNLPFEQLPYLCFQEARKVLAEDRAEKLAQIESTRARIQNLEATEATKTKGGSEAMKQTRLKHLREYLEELKIAADINDPLIKKRFEDGEGDMNKPIYRYLADRKWRSYQRLLVQQRIDQLGLVPDLLPHFDPTADVRLAFKLRNVQPGEFIDSRVSEVPLKIKLQLFDKGERLLTVLVIDSDVPNVETDSFSTRCHYMATNIPFGPVDTTLLLSRLPAEHVVHTWLPPFAQKGSPYHRYSVFIVEQKPGQVLPVSELKASIKRDGFRLRSFVDRHDLKPIGANVFRSVWDEGTAGVMQRHNISGATVEFKQKKVIALKPKQKARGWEARHASDKYKPVRAGRGIDKR